MGNYSKYGYKQYSMILDPAESEEKEIMKWMKKNKTRKLNYSKMLKEAIKEYIAQKENQ